MPVMFDNTRFRVESKTFPPDEIAVRLHHRLTQIHGFPNGNGRHARMMADLLIEKLGGKAFTWGSVTIHETGALRDAYITALQAADNHDFQPLMVFVRS
jgi:Fic-DOC domain mobile mystery protein B